MINTAELKAAMLGDELICSRLKFDCLTDLMYYDGQLLSGPVRADLLIDLQKRLGLHVNILTLHQVLDAMELEPQFRFHPITQWLDTLTWDEECRLQTFFPNYCNAMMDVGYMRAVAENFFVGMVARAYEPGCKMDTMLILEGMQGIGKSRALRVIGGKWYREHKTNGIGTKDMLQAMKGAWVYDINELRGLESTDRRVVKAMLSSQEDYFRLPYRSDPSIHKRSGVVVGSTNDELYLSDETGNRRFWPIRCGYKVEVEMLERDRDALFAEAVAMYRSGHQWWLMPDQIHNEIVMARSYISPYFERVCQFIGNGSHLPRYATYTVGTFATPQVYCYVHREELLEYLKLTPAHWRDRISRDVSNCMRALQFELVMVRDKTIYGKDEGRQIKVWRRHMGASGTVSLIPEKKPEPATPALTIVSRENAA